MDASSLYSAPGASMASLTFSSETKKFSDQTHAAATLKQLNQSRLDAFLCDVEIVVGDRSFPAHRCVLAAAIPYFNSMFRSNMKESGQQQIIIQDIPVAALEQLLGYAYTCQIDISSHNVQQLLYAASVLLMDSVCAACQQYLTNYLSVSNCLQLRAFAQQHNCVDLLKSVDSFAFDHFQELRKSPEFLQIPLEHLHDLIDSPDLHVNSETEVFETIVAWVSECPAERQPHLAQLMQRVRLAILPLPYLVKHVKINPMIMADSTCRDLVADALEEKICATESCSRPRTLAQHNALSPTRPRKSAAGVVFCVGGRGTTGDPFRTVEAYDWRKNRWFPVTEMGVRRRFAIGGHDGLNHLESAECFNPATNSWSPVASMEVRRRGIAVGALDGAIYAVGGLDDTSCFQTVERYDIELDRWHRVESMNVQRGGVGVAALDRILFAVGGNDGTSSLDSCERYVPHLNKWINIACMAHRRAGAGVTVLDNSLYAIGGFDDNAPLSSCERYDPLTNSWTMLPSMSCPRGGVGVASLGGRIYAVGGHDGKTYLDSVECFDPATNAWLPVTNISQCRAGAGFMFAFDERGGDSKLRHLIKFSWTHSMLSLTPTELSDAWYEYLHMSVNMALWYTKHAAKLAGADDIKEAQAKEAHKSLRRAAGLFEAVLKERGRINEISEPGGDMDDHVLNAYAVCTTAEAQEVTVARAIELNHSSSLVSSLAYETSKLFTKADGSLATLDPAVFGKWRAYVQLKTAFYRALAYAYLGGGLLGEDKCGEAVRACREGLSCYAEAEKLAAEYGRLKGPGRSIKPEKHLFFRRIQPILKRHIEKAERENGFIYHQKIPDEIPELEMKSTTFGLAKPEPFEMPHSTEVWNPQVYAAFNVAQASMPDFAKGKKADKELPAVKEAPVYQSEKDSNSTSGCVVC